jgi:hypothetical protein
MQEVGLQAVLIGNAAAALQGAPVTTVDFDFFFRKTPRNMAKVKALARALHATVLRPYYPVSDLFRVVRDIEILEKAHAEAASAASRAQGSQGRE